MSILVIVLVVCFSSLVYTGLYFLLPRLKKQVEEPKFDMLAQETRFVQELSQ